jgi:hypothetical protein
MSYEASLDSLADHTKFLASQAEYKGNAKELADDREKKTEEYFAAKAHLASATNAYQEAMKNHQSATKHHEAMSDKLNKATEANMVAEHEEKVSRESNENLHSEAKEAIKKHKATMKAAKEALR